MGTLPEAHPKLGRVGKRDLKRIDSSLFGNETIRSEEVAFVQWHHRCLIGDGSLPKTCPGFCSTTSSNMSDSVRSFIPRPKVVPRLGGGCTNREGIDRIESGRYCKKKKREYDVEGNPCKKCR
jgi:hypothetical protein